MNETTTSSFQKPFIWGAVILFVAIGSAMAVDKTTAELGSIISTIASSKKYEHAFVTVVVIRISLPATAEAG